MNPEKWSEIFGGIQDLIKKAIDMTKESLEKLWLNNWILSELFWLKNESENNNNGWNNNNNNNENNWNNNVRENSERNTDLEKLKWFFEKNSENISIDIIDGKKFFEVSYTDKYSGSKVKWIIPFSWNWDSNIYMPGDRSGIKETIEQKNFKEMVTSKNSKKARFIFEWDADKIYSWTQSARYDKVINNFEHMTSPIKLAGNNPKINIIWHSRAGRTVDSLLWKYWFINRYIIIDWTYWVYKHVRDANIPGKIFHTNGKDIRKYIENYENKPNIEIYYKPDYIDHEKIVAQALFDNPDTYEELFA